MIPPNFTVLNNIASLKDEKDVSTGFRIVLGRSTRFDGEGGIYIWDSSSTDTGNDFRTVVSNHYTTGRWKKLL